MANHPEMALVDVYAAVLEDFSFEPMLHVHYETKTVSLKVWTTQIQGGSKQLIASELIFYENRDLHDNVSSLKLQLNDRS